MTASILTEELPPAEAVVAPPPPPQEAAASHAASPGTALLRASSLRGRALLLTLCAVLPGVAVLGWLLHAEFLGLSMSGERLRALTQSELVLSAGMALSEDALAASPGAEPLRRLGALLERLQHAAANQPDLGRQAQALRQRLAAIERTPAAGAAAGLDALQRDIEVLQFDLLQGLALPRDADARVRDPGRAATQALPLLARSLRSTLQTARGLASPDAAQRRELAQRLLQQRAEAALALEQARAALQRGVAAGWLDGAAVSAGLAQVQAQLAAIEPLARAAQAETPAVALQQMQQDYLRQTQRSLLSAAQLQSRALAALREALQPLHDAQWRRAVWLATGAAAWLLGLCYLLACAAGLLGESLRRLRDETAALDDGAAPALPEAPGDELQQACARVRQAAQRLTHSRERLGAAGDAVARDAQAAGAQQGSLALRSGELRGACGEVAQRLAAFGAHFDDCAHSAEGALAELLALADEALHGRRAIAGLRTRLLAASGSNREAAHVVQNIEVVAQQTRRLVLNAIVEAERIGAPGQGFAVLLQELRSLAQRNEQAARGLHPVVAGTVIEIDDCHRACERVSQAEQDTERRLQAVHRGIGDLVRRAESGSGEARQLLQSARRVDAGLDDLVERVEQLSRSLAALRDQSGMLRAAAQAVVPG